MTDVLSSSRLIERLRSIRQAQGKSAQTVADLSGIPRNVIANMETGRRESISVDEAAAICAALGVDLCSVLVDRHELRVVSEVKQVRYSLHDWGPPEFLRREAMCPCGWVQNITDESGDDLLWLHDAYEGQEV